MVKDIIVIYRKKINYFDVNQLEKLFFVSVLVLEGGGFIVLGRLFVRGSRGVGTWGSRRHPPAWKSTKL